VSKGRVFRVVIGDKGYDLMGAFAKASARDWAALIGATGRNPFTVSQRISEMQEMGKASETERGALLAGPFGGRLVETIADLVFLARRMEGDREPGTDRPITPETSFDTTPVMETLDGFAAAMRAQSEGGDDDEPDPT
jgi:hypothetical protein